MKPKTKSTSVFSHRSLKVLLYLALVLALYFAFQRYFRDCSALHQFLHDSGWLAPFLYFFVSTLSMMILVPRTIFVVLAGVCFGVYSGAILITISSLSPAALSFLISRYAARAKFESLMSKKAWFYRLELMASESGLSLVIVTRAVHIIHYGLSNYAFGLLPISFSHFMIGTFLGLFPGTVALVYGGNMFGCTLLERGFDLPPEIQSRLIWATFLLTTSAVLPLFWQYKRQGKRKSPKSKP